jgi:hypothetical protein
MSYRYITIGNLLLLAGALSSFAATSKVKGPPATPAQGAACVTGGLVTALSGTAGSELKEEDDPLKKGASKSKAVAAQADESDLTAFEAGTPTIPGGVKPWSELPIRDQCDEEICWSFSLNEFVDGESRQAGGTQDITSADHNGFWHLYAQFFNHKEYFNELRKKVDSGKISKDEAVKEAGLMLRLRPGSATAKAAGFVVSPGSNESTALLEANVVGFVPNSLFEHVIKTPKEGTAFQNALNSLIGEFLSDKSKLSTYTTTAADGINDDLYNLLVTNLKPYYGGKSAHPPYRPNDTFTDGGKTYTPLTYMAQALKFDPTQFVEVTMTAKNQKLLLQAVDDALMAPDTPGNTKMKKAVPIGFPIYNQQLAESQSIFADNTMAPQPIGGHEIVIENSLSGPAGGPNAGTRVGLVAQNSWGTGITGKIVGLTVDGKPTSKPADAGYYGFTLSYLINTAAAGEPSSFMLPKAILDKPEYASLRPSK